MYLGYWREDFEYKKGYIIVSYSNQYYICNVSHKSNNLTYPSEEDVYWIHISSAFINNLLNTNISNVSNVIQNNESRVKFRGTPRLRLQINTKNTKNTKSLSDSESEQKKQEKDLQENEKNLQENEKDLQEKDLQENEKGLEEKKQQKELKRKLEEIETDIREYKRKRYNNVNSLRDKLLLMNIDRETKSFVIDKYDNTSKMSGSDYSKGMNWLKTLSKIPYGKYKGINITKEDDPKKISEFFKNIRDKLDESIYGLDDVKQEILEFVARKVTNPDSKGHVLALYGPAGVGKTKIIKSLASALNLPFQQINFGGLNDVSVLTGHSETYIGSKPGKVVETLIESNYMNPIIYLDEIDKVSESKSTEIFGTLTHLLDEEQNNSFQDNYFSNIKIDLSKAFFVLAFNDITKIDKIVADRLKIIYINPPNIQDKLIICKDKLIPDVIKSIKLKNDINIQIDTEVIEYIINKTQTETGVRQLRKNIEKIMNRLNYDMLINNFEILKIESSNIVVTRTYVDTIIKNTKEDLSYMSMYI
jgi:ATP-dependent Lon protease